MGHPIVSVRRLLFALVSILLLSLPLQATEYFVSPTGDDTKNAGTDELHPFQTTSYADTKLVPGDTLTLLDGTYPPVKIDKSGTPAQWITLRARNSRKAIISLAAGWHDGGSRCVDLSHISYLKVIGLMVLGCAESDHTVVDAQHGISINGCHHILIRDCRVKDCSGAGIGGYDKFWDAKGQQDGPLDFITIEGNEVSGCAFWCKYLSSGISVCNAKDAGLGKDPSGYNFVIRNNICYANENKIGEFSKDIKNVGTATDGNGIIIDYFTPNNHYPYNVLVEGNLCYDNGGRGIHVFNSANTTVRYNTCWHNNRNQLAYSMDRNQGEISCVYAKEINVLDNIAVANPNAWSSALVLAGATNVTLSINLLEGPRSVSSAEGTNEKGTIIGDPLFINPSADPTQANFRLKAGSPAIGASDSASTPAADLDGDLRAQGGGNSLGAYAFGKK